MRICLVSQEYPPGYVGGIGTQSQVKARGLATLGHDVHVVTAGDEFGAALVSHDDGPLRVHEVRTPGGDFPVYRPETYWLGYTWAVLGALRSLAETEEYDVIDFPDYSAEGLAFLLDRQEDDPAAVVHLHGSLSMFSEHIGWPEPKAALYRLGTVMEELAIQSADRLLASSASIADFTASLTSVPADHIDVVQGAVDTDAFTPRPEAARADLDDPIRVLFVGNLAANKGVYTVFEAFMRLASGSPGLSLVIAGSGDDEIADQIKSEADRAGVSDRLTMLGFVEHAELPALYRSADVLAAPSQYEGGLGMVYLEAMACGLPVIATAAGGAAEAVVESETGLLLEQGSVAETTAALETLLADSALRARMGAAARARAVKRFSAPRYAERVLEAYQRAIEHRQATVATG